MADARKTPSANKALGDQAFECGSDVIHEGCVESHSGGRIRPLRHVGGIWHNIGMQKEEIYAFSQTELRKSGPCGAV